MAPTMADTQKMHTSGAKVENPSTYNNNIAEISEDDLPFPVDKNIVRFWPFACSQQSYGKNLLQITPKKPDGLQGVKNVYAVDFNGCAYDKDENKNFMSELKWMGVDSTDPQRVTLSMHDPIKLDKFDFPYVLCTYKYKDVVSPCAVHHASMSSLPSLSTKIFKIQSVSLGSISLFTINESEQPMSPYFIGRSPDGYAIQITSHRQPFLVNPMTLMFMSDQGIRIKDEDVKITKRKWYRR